MKKIIFSIALVFMGFSVHSQIMVNEHDITTDTNTFEVWAFVKPFNTKESYFVNYGQDKFRPNYYDHKSQAVFNKDNVKFEKGQWLQLYNYILSMGYVQQSERQAKIGDAEGRVITFAKKQ